MKAEEKQALIEDCQREIAHLNRCIKAYPGEPVLKRDLLRNEIALAALSPQPVKLPKGFSPGIGDLFDKAAPVMRRDSEGGKWLHKAVVTQILNELGYEVQE